MTLEEYRELESGDHVWVSRVEFSKRGRSNVRLLARLEKIGREDKFRVIEIKEGGKRIKVGDTISPRYYYFSYPNLFRTKEEATEHWNSVVHNTIDRLTSEYEQTMKRLKKKIMS